MYEEWNPLDVLRLLSPNGQNDATWHLHQSVVMEEHGICENNGHREPYLLSATVDSGAAMTSIIRDNEIDLLSLY